ncbi:hypothetical protein [Duganella violaceipulchra]|uniref:Uncharacterized protein n=1 Tax=Duganella violaceipulchra TaxID=2849652 RepID=A0AA41H7I0_9BURK|nr:hypothetical protein [Duganella violaceicalia]MBV6321975.1 hypothetical protein [Duganella violaceicalia]MCP2007028.1 hypothetical protein [Duganella violaceicalia]
MSAGTPRVDACIEAVSMRFPSLTSTTYFQEVHQYITPLARQMEREVADLLEAKQVICAWSPDANIESTWASSCGELWSFIDGDPKENRVSFCHHCGKRVELKGGA